MMTNQLSLQQLSKALQQKELSSVELVQQCLTNIAKSKDLNAFISLDEEQALAQAKHADAQLSQKRATVLTGIPMGVKDLFCTHEMNTTCGSKMLANFQAPYEATLITNLKNNGAIVLGKTNMDEFAMGSSNQNSYFGAVKNPWDKTRVPGGSSGGSAAAVAAGLVPFSIGSDTGGSIRQPAAFCGLSGIKPTYGLVSRFGMVAYASSLDQAGPMAKSAQDLALVLGAMSGFDAKDSTSIDTKTPNYSDALDKPLEACRIALPTSFFEDSLNPAIERSLRNAVEVFKKLGAQILEVDLNYLNLWVPCYYVIACAEASSNLSRYDGLRFGHRSTNDASLIQLIKASRSEGFGEEVKRRILTGTHVLSAGFFDAYYLKAQKIRRLIQQELLTILKNVDFILGPTTPTTAFELGVPVTNPVQNYLADVYTVAANLAGIPALSIPAGFDKGLPIGLQMMGNAFSEARLLQIAHHYQQQTDWHLASPITS